MSEPGSSAISPRPVPAQDRRLRIRILVVDDSAAVRQYLAVKLEQLADDSFHVDIDMASSGEEAVEHVLETPYDLVFLDVVMPGMGGHEACRRIKGIRKTRVAMLSSLKSQTDHQEGHIAGCDNYLTKPPRDADLQAVLRIVYLRKSISSHAGSSDK